MDEEKNTQGNDAETNVNLKPEETERAVDQSTLTHTANMPTPPPRIEHIDTTEGDVKYSERNHLVAVLLAAFTPFGLTRFYTGHKDGKYRVYWLLGLIVLFLASGLLVVVTGLSGLSVVIMFVVGAVLLASFSVLYVWGIIDFVLSLTRNKDAKGLPLQASEYDMKWAKGIFYTIIGLIVAYFLLLVVSYASFSVVDVNNTFENDIPWSI